MQTETKQLISIIFFCPKSKWKKHIKRFGDILDNWLEWSAKKN